MRLDDYELMFINLKMPITAIKNGLKQKLV